MRLFKVLGSGPHADFVAYGEILPGSFYDNNVTLKLDKAYQLYNYELNRILVSTETGAIKIGQVESDLFHLDPFDLPRLQEAKSVHDYHSTCEMLFDCFYEVMNES